MGTQLPAKGSHPQSAHVRCGRMAGWIKMPLGMEVGLGQGNCVNWGTSSPKKGHSPPIFGPCLLLANGWMEEDATWYRGRPRPRRHCLSWGPSSSQKGHSLQFSAHVRCGQTAGWIKMPLGREVGLGPGDTVRWGPSSPLKGVQPSNFRPMSIVAKTVVYLRCCSALVVFEMNTLTHFSVTITSTEKSACSRVHSNDL